MYALIYICMCPLNRFRDKSPFDSPVNYTAISKSPFDILGSEEDTAQGLWLRVYVRAYMSLGGV